MFVLLVVVNLVEHIPYFIIVYESLRAVTGKVEVFCGIEFLDWFKRCFPIIREKMLMVGVILQQFRNVAVMQQVLFVHWTTLLIIWIMFLPVNL